MVDWQGRSLIDLASLTAAEIEAILTQALAMKKFIASGAKKRIYYEAKRLSMCFPKIRHARAVPLSSQGSTSGRMSLTSIKAPVQ